MAWAVAMTLGPLQGIPSQRRPAESLGSAAAIRSTATVGILSDLLKCYASPSALTARSPAELHARLLMLKLVTSS